MTELDHFARLGLPRRFALDPREVERQYLARSRDLHPDFHQLGSSAEQAASLDLSARLNEANAVLRDPFKRAECLLALEGGPTAGEQKEMPAAFLEEVLELRMEIEELRETEPPDSPARQAMERRLTERRDALLAEVGDEFEKLGAAADRTAVLRGIRQRLNATKYVQNLLRDLHSV
jgi:molecular chaperone HscB